MSLCRRALITSRLWCSAALGASLKTFRIAAKQTFPFSRAASKKRHSGRCASFASAIVCAQSKSHCAPCVLLYFYYHPLPEIRRRRRSSFSYASFSTSREWGPLARASMESQPHVCDALRLPAYAIFRCNPQLVVFSPPPPPFLAHMRWRQRPHRAMDCVFFQQLMTTNYTRSMAKNYKALKYDSINSFTLKHRLQFYMAL